MMKNKLLVIILVCVLCVGLGLIVLISFVVPRQYITTDIEDYGNYVGNYDNRSVEEFVFSFFPKEIQTNFSNITYSYRAQKNDTYAFEAYLEFTIEKESEYEAFITQNTSGLERSVFCYDDSYTEYTIADEFSPAIAEVVQDGYQEISGTHIRYARIGKILCSQKEQRLIYVALGVYDGGIVTTDFLCTYFNRFHINPLEYSRTAGG